MTRNLYFILNQKNAWCQNLVLTPEALQQLRFWLKEIANFNGHQIWPKPSAVRVVYSDASDTGYGGYMVEHGNMVANGQWSEEVAKLSSTWCELHAVRLILEAFQTLLKNERVCWFSDNQNVVRIVQYSSRKPILQVKAHAIFSICMNNLIKIEPEWIPRDQNKLADSWVAWWSMMIGCWIQRFSACWMPSGGSTLLIDLQIQWIPSWNDIVPDIWSLVLKL